MIKYLMRRLLLMVPTLLGVTLFVFLLVALSPGGVGATMREAGAGETMAQSSSRLEEAYLEDRYGLDQPVLVQYMHWLERISPVRLGTRDQVMPSGDRVVPPRGPNQPPLWRWFVDELPTRGASRLEIARTDDAERRVEEFRRQRARYARARLEYVKAVTELKEALGAYAESLHLERARDEAGRVRVEVIARAGLRPEVAAWGEVESRGKGAVAAYGAALDAQADLERAFAARPYPEAGWAVIPGVLSVAAPDLGRSHSRGQPVADLIARALPVTLLLNLLALPLIYLIAIPGGMLAASRRGSVVDRGLGLWFVALWSFPIVLAGVLAVGFLANGRDYLGWFPASGHHAPEAEQMPFFPGAGPGGGWQRGYLLDTLWHICLPVVCLVYPGLAVLSKQTRAALLENFSADYVRTARAKGASPRRVLLRHVLRNSLLPLITMVVTVFPALLSGSVVVERIFSVPGMGSLMWQAILDRDRELLLANTLIIGLVSLLALLLADILYALADPRIRFGRA